MTDVPQIPSSDVGGPHHRVERTAHAIYGLIILTATIGELRLHHEEMDVAIAFVAAGAVVLVVAHTYSRLVASAATIQALPEPRVAATHLVDQLALAVPAVCALGVLALAQGDIIADQTAYNIILIGSLAALFGLGVLIGSHRRVNVGFQLLVGTANLTLGILIILIEFSAPH
jgi:hypothetical protein